jgi:uncharacterized protein YabN with tetrapyrrole methylase and pyrophosphatase domain
MNEQEIYDYLQNAWDELKKRDGGYYPSKHDPQVFKQAAKHFNITVDTAKKVFDKLSMKYANEKVNKLSNDPQTMKKSIEDIVKDNKEFPCK